MLRIFLKSDLIYKLDKDEKTKEIGKFTAECENVESMFKKLLKAAYPVPMSNFGL